MKAWNESRECIDMRGGLNLEGRDSNGRLKVEVGIHHLNLEK